MRENANNKSVKTVPIRNIKMMADEEWNRLAYKNWIERNKK